MTGAGGATGGGRDIWFHDDISPGGCPMGCTELDEGKSS